MTVDRKVCPECGEHLPASAFYPDATKASGLHTYCTACHSEINKRRYRANAEKRRSAARRYRTKHPEKYKDSRLRAVYGISLAQWQAMFDSQNGLCANPKCSAVATDVDHDHSCCGGPKSCGKCVRWLLCGPCNKTEGLLGGDVDRLRGLADLMERGTPTPRG